MSTLPTNSNCTEALSPRDCDSTAATVGGSAACTSARSKRSGASNVIVILSSLRSTETAISAGRPNV